MGKKAKEAKSREKLYDVVEERKVKKKDSNPLDEAIEEEDRELAREAKRLKLQAIVAKRKRNLKELEEEKREGTKPEVDLTPSVARELAKLPDEERDKVIQVYQMLKMAEKTPSSDMLPLMLVGYARANPQASQTSMVEFAKVMSDQLKTGIDLAKETRPLKSEASWNPVELIKTFGNLITDNVKKPMEEIIAKVQPQPSALEAILMNDKLFERAKTLGMFGGGTSQGLTPDVALEIEKLKTDRDLKIEELRQQQQKWLVEQQAEERKWKQIGKIFEGPIGKTLEQFGKAGADRVRKGGSVSVPGVTPTQITCPKCQKPFYGYEEAGKVICPHCGTILQKAPVTTEAPQPIEEPKEEGEPTASE